MILHLAKKFSIAGNVADGSWGSFDLVSTECREQVFETLRLLYRRCLFRNCSWRKWMHSGKSRLCSRYRPDKSSNSIWRVRLIVLHRWNTGELLKTAILKKEFYNL